MRQLIVSIIVLVLVLYSSISAQAATEADGRTQGAPEYYFWNEVTGDVQWEDPGDVPYETSSGSLYWVAEDGTVRDQDEKSLQYVWLEGWSEDYQRPFFYNQESKQSSWDRPPDLAWRRIAIETQQS
ncbi:g2712 [Coccomyxa viridis]|uniref:G2712 protein n=1 Tax=Coccomyxa viridis TaxID=1274662 RepID=A0ABP1FL26_9CHLO